ncbi:MAG: amidohydrolase [Chloroflexi bacterium]|nr:MAG: amidohydrolase [Chloroflexota bacterium]
MRIIDTHCHAAPVWYEPVESLVYQMDQNNVEQAVLVQIRGYFDNDYQFECEKQYPGRFISVVLVDVGRPDAPDQLERLAEQGARGVRLAPDDCSPGADPLAIWRKAAELGLPVSCGGAIEGFAAADFAQLVATFPTLPIIVEHLASLKATDGQLPPEVTRRQIWALAHYPNVYMKIHGLGEICRRNLPVTTPFPFDPAGLTILREAYAAFGAERLMWGSDYPPVSGREGYAAALRFPLAEFASLSETARALIFGGVAAKLYGLAE